MFASQHPPPTTPTVTVQSPVALSPPDNPTSPTLPEDASQDRLHRNIRITPDAEMELSEEEEPPKQDEEPVVTRSEQQPLKRRRYDSDEYDSDDDETYTLHDKKRYLYQLLGQQSCPLPPVKKQTVAPILMQQNQEEEPDFRNLPLSALAHEALSTHNRLVLGVDPEASEEDISCTDRKLADIPHDADITIKGVSVTKQHCQGLKPDKHYGLHSSEFSSKTAVVDQDMQAQVRHPPPAVATIQQWEEVERTGRLQVVILSTMEFMVAGMRHHLAAARISQEAHQKAVAEGITPLPPVQQVEFGLMDSFYGSLAQAIRHSLDCGMKQVTNGVLVRRNSYLAKSTLHDRVKKPLRALPIQSRKLFAGRMQEATDLDREERKAQPARSQSSSRGSKPQGQSQNQSKSSQGQTPSQGYSSSKGDSYKGSSNSGRSQSQQRGKRDSRGKFPRGRGRGGRGSSGKP